MTTSASTQSAQRTPDAASPATLLYGDLDNELAITRRFLERYPDGKGDWKPHEKSMALSSLATHLAQLPGFGAVIAGADEMDFAKTPYAPKLLDTAAELVAAFDAKVAEMRPVIAAVDFAALERPWTLRNGETVIVSAPKGGLVRVMMISHIVHHRAQLGVYYRLLGVPVPSTYGPSADEGF